MRKLLAFTTAVLVAVLFIGVNYQVQGLTVRPFDPGLAATLFLFAGVAAIAGQIGISVKDPIIWSFLGLYFYICINALVMSSSTEAVISLIQTVEYALLILLLAEITWRPECRRVFLKTLLLTIAVMVVFTAGWYISRGIGFGFKGLGDTRYLFGPFALLATVLYSLQQKRVYACLFGASLVLMLLSGERKGWVAFAGAGVFIFVIRGKIFKHSLGLSKYSNLQKTAAVCVFLTASIVVVSGVPYVSDQMYSTWDAASGAIKGGASYREGVTGSNQARLYLIRFTVASVKENPLFGIGTGRFKEVLRLFGFGEGFTLGAHSKYQQVAVENGLVGLGMYVLVWIVMMKRSLLLAKNAHKHQVFPVLTAAGLTAYGAIVNFFLGGGALNIIFMALPAGLLMGITYETNKIKRNARETSRERRQVQVVHYGR